MVLSQYTSNACYSKCGTFLRMALLPCLGPNYNTSQDSEAFLTFSHMLNAYACEWGNNALKREH